MQRPYYMSIGVVLSLLAELVLSGEPKDPAEALDTIKTRPGFHIEMVAAEPLLRDPIAIAFDENGRLFVVEFPEYNHRHANWELNDQGRVRVLEDTDGDGRFDKSVIYVGQLASPTGVLCYDGGIFVAAAPDILFCKDTDGDGQADVRERVFTGFAISAERGGGARLNSLRWGLDNRIHLCTSFSGGEIRRVGEESEPVSVRNRGFAFDPRTFEFAATSGAGQHGLAIDDRGRFFLCNNSDPFRLLMYESRYLTRNPHVVAPPSYVSIAAEGKFTRLYRLSPVEPWRIERTRRRVEGLYAGSAEGGTPAGFFTSATGVAVYRGDAWPDGYRGDIFVCQPSGNLIHRAKLKASGVELIAARADEEAEFVASSDNWFRPVELVNAPDGTMYVVDMYRELIETALALPPDVLAELTPGAGTDRGRIYRIAPDGFTRRSRPRLGRLSTAELTGLLEHRNAWHRDTAARLLYQRRDRAAIAPLRGLAVGSSLPEGRVAALHALEGLGELDAPTLLSALRDPLAYVRVHAVRLAEKLTVASAVERRLFKMTSDPSLLVRYQLAFSLGEVDSGDPRNAALAELAVRDGSDPWMRFAVLSSLREGAGQVFDTLLADSDFRGTAHGGEFLIALARQIGAANQEADVVAFARGLDDLTTEDKSLSLVLARALVERSSRAKRGRILAAAGRRAVQLLDELLAAAKADSTDATLADDKRATAVRALGMGAFDEFQSRFSELLDPHQPLAVQTAALETLAEFDDKAVATLVLDVWPQLSPQLRSVATETLLSRRPWIHALLDAVEARGFSRGDLDTARIDLLKKHPDDDIRERVSQVFATGPSHRAEVVRHYQAALHLTGDAMRGKQVFKKVCSTCHELEGVGTAVGAELNAIRDRGRSEVLLNVLDPNREVKPKFLSYIAQVDDGRVLTGMIVTESANGVVLRRPDGTSVTVQRTEIEQLRSTGLSFMPEGLEKDIDPQAMADLLAYLVPAG